MSTSITETRNLTDEEVIAEIHRLEAEIEDCHNEIRWYRQQIDDLTDLLRSRRIGPAPEESQEYALPPVNGPEDYVP
jgi:SMC interacting uncharacterized protein involved in chromosome segregation